MTPDHPSPTPEGQWCPATTGGDRYQCDLPAGHTGRHAVAYPILTWPNEESPGGPPEKHTHDFKAGTFGIAEFCACGESRIIESPTPAPEGGEAKCKCGDPACPLWREDEVCPYCSAKSAALDADPDYEGRSGEGHYGECAHGERPTPTSAEGGEEQTGTCLRCGTPLYGGEGRTFTVCTPCWDIEHPKSSPTPATTGGEEDPDPLERWLHNIQTYPRSGASQEAASGIRSHVHALRRQLAEAAERREASAVARLAIEAEYEAEVAALTERATTAERRLEEAQKALEQTGIEGIMDEFQSLADAFTQMGLHINRLEPDLTASQQEVARLREALWTDSNLIQMDPSVVFSSGYDFGGWESARQEVYTSVGFYAVWPDRIANPRAWSAYGGPDDALMLERFPTADAAKAWVWEQIRAALSTPQQDTQPTGDPLSDNASVQQ